MFVKIGSLWDHFFWVFLSFTYVLLSLLDAFWMFASYLIILLFPCIVVYGDGSLCAMFALRWGQIVSDNWNKSYIFCKGINSDGSIMLRLISSLNSPFQFFNQKILFKGFLLQLQSSSISPIIGNHRRIRLPNRTFEDETNTNSFDF